MGGMNGREQLRLLVNMIIVGEKEHGKDDGGRRGDDESGGGDHCAESEDGDAELVCCLLR